MRKCDTLRTEQNRTEQNRTTIALYKRLARFADLGYYPYLYERIWEKVHGVDFLQGTSDGIDTERGNNPYSATNISALDALKKYFKKLNITSKDAIIDIGCGKGRMVYFFSKFPFGHVSGLEYSNEIAAIGNNNMGKLFKLQTARGRISIIQGDATLYTDYDRYNYFYLYNPFNENIMTAFLENLKASVARSPRKIHIIYYNPLHHDLLIKMGMRFEKELPLRKKFLSPTDNAKLQMFLYNFGEMEQ